MDFRWSLRCICTDTVHHINKPLFRLGRHRQHEIVCSSVVISREHANFIVKDSQLFLKDLGSSNGSYINGKRIQETKCLHDGDIVSFGLPVHSNPCSAHGCFIYQVNDTAAVTSTVDIIGILENSEIQTMPKQSTELELKSDTSRNEGSAITIGSDSLNSSSVTNLNTLKSETEIKVEPKEPMEFENKKQPECSYSIVDSVIVIDSDLDNMMELSASQLFPVDDPFMKIKEELSEYDRVNEQLPVIVDSDDDSNFDILGILAGSPSIGNSDINIPIQNECQKSNILDDHQVGTNDINVNEHHDDDAYDKNKENTEATNTDTLKNLATESADGIMRVSSAQTTVSKSFSSCSKYVKPPVIDAHILVKPRFNIRTKSKENDRSSLKRHSTSGDKIDGSKKQKTENIEPQPSTSGLSTRRIRHNRNNSLSKENKLQIKEDRKQKLKKISTRINDAEAGSSTSSTRLYNKPCVKISKSRGDFMVNEAPPSVNNGKKSIKIDQKSSKIKKTAASSSKTSPQAPSTSNDPRLKTVAALNTISIQNMPSTSNVIKQVVLPDVTNKDNDHLLNNNYVSSTRNGFHNKNTVENSMLQFNAYNNKSTLTQNNVLLRDILNIVSWRTQWLEEQKRSSTNPPVNKRTAVKMCNSFSNHNDYCSVVKPLLMIELWNEVYEDWISIDTTEKRNQRKFSSIIETVDAKPTHFILKCTVYITNKQNRSKQYVKENNIVVVNVPTESDGKFVYQNLFGFVISCEKRLIKGHDFVDKYLSRQLMPDIPELLLHLDIAIKATSNKICLNKYMEGATLLFLVSLTREFDAVNNLGLSPLCKFILDPKVEDYNISPKPLANGITMDELNEVQRKVVHEATQLCVGDKPGIYLVQGPPGTGKTTVIKNIVRNIILNSSKKTRVLLTAPSNSAIDSLAIKIIKELKAHLLDSDKKRIKLVRVGPWTSVHAEMKPYLLDKFAKDYLTKNFLHERPEVRRDFNSLINKRKALKAEIEKANGTSLDVIKEKLAMVDSECERFAQNYMKQEYPQAFDNAKRVIYDGSNIICTTLSSCVRLKELNNSAIDCCIVDEATQSKESETLIPLMLGVSKLVLVGDPQQLPAVTTSQYAKQLEYGQSLFQRIKKNFIDKPINPIRMLNVQHRMHPDISLFPNNTFYNGELKNSNNYRRRKDLCKILPYYVLNLNLKHNQKNEQNLNKEEIKFVERLVNAISSIITDETRSEQVSVGIITPYNTQKDALIKMFDNSSLPAEMDITVNTIDSFQGLEKDIIILSSVRYRPNIFLSDEQRLNVALTRAKHALYIVGTYSLFQNCTLLNRLKTDADRRKLYSNIHTITDKVLRKIIRCPQ